MGSELRGWTKPSLGQRAGAIAVPVMLVLFLLNAPAAVAITSTQDAGAQPAENQPLDNQVVIEVTFDRRLSGDRVGQHKVPPLSPVNMTITAIVSSQVENATLTDYFPNDWTVVDTNGGVASVYDEEYNKIEWSVGAVSDFVSRSYVVRSPQRTLPPTKYYFHSELTYEGGSAIGDDWRVIVADPSEYLTNPSFTDNADGWTLSVTVHDVVTYQDTAGSIETETEPKRNNTKIGTATQTISATINSTDTVKLSLWWKKSHTTVVGPITQTVAAEILKPSGGGDWANAVRIWEDTQTGNIDWTSRSVQN